MSDEEVIHKEVSSKLYHVRYAIEGGAEEWITIATTRPETILGDTAVAVHPEDERYARLKGRRVIVPLAERSVPLIFDVPPSARPLYLLVGDNSTGWPIIP